MVDLVDVLVQERCVQCPVKEIVGHVFAHHAETKCPTEGEKVWHVPGELQVLQHGVGQEQEWEDDQSVVEGNVFETLLVVLPGWVFLWLKLVSIQKMPAVTGPG